MNAALEVAIWFSHVAWFSSARSGHVLGERCQSDEVDAAIISTGCMGGKTTYGICNCAMARVDATTVAAPPTYRQGTLISWET